MKFKLLPLHIINFQNSLQFKSDLFCFAPAFVLPSLGPCRPPLCRIRPHMLTFTRKCPARLVMGRMGDALGREWWAVRCFRDSHQSRYMGSGIPKFLLKESLYAPDGFNRWRVPPAAIGVHMCIGSVYSWSILNEPLTKELGVVAQAAGDWSLGGVVPVFSTAIVCLGLSAAAGGHWLEKVGPRLVGLTAAGLWGGGFLVGGLGVQMHNLPMLYAGYGVMGGCGLGLGYVSPVSTLIRWFPDKRGMATGMAIMGFGGGAMLGAPMKETLLGFWSSPPTYLGPVSEVTLRTVEGVRYAVVSTGMGTGAEVEELEVVVASAADLVSSTLDLDIWQDLCEGVYIVGTGDTGTAMTFLTLGSLYTLVMTVSSFQYRIPQEGWSPEGWISKPPLKTEVDTTKACGSNESFAPRLNIFSAGMTTQSVHIDQSLYTPQFWQLWLNLCLNVTAGIGVIGVAKTMMGDIFASSLPNIVDGAFSATYVTAISVANMSGRFAWASASDFLGRKNTFSTFFLFGIPLYVSVPVYAGMAVENPGSLAPLIGFYASTMIIFTFYGGGFATIPAYLADVFGTKHVGGIHGRLLTAWSTAGVVGPLSLTYLRRQATESAAEELASKVDPKLFENTFGSGPETLNELMEANTVTIAKLMDIVPAGTCDPTPHLYDTTMYAMSGLLGVAFISNLLMRPVASKHWTTSTSVDETEKKENRMKG